MNGWCSQWDCSLVEAKSQYIFYGTFYKETVVYTGVDIEKKHTQKETYSRISNSWICHVEQTGFAHLKCRNFYVLWIIHNYSYSLYKSKQTQLLIFFLIYFNFKSLAFVIYRKTDSVLFYATGSTYASRISPYSVKIKQINLNVEYLIQALNSIGMKITDVLCCDKNLIFSFIFFPCFM